MTDLDLVLTHYALRHKKHMLELSKAVKPEYFTGVYGEFYGILQGGMANPQIKEVLGLPALMDYCDRNNMSHRKDAFQKIYNDAQELRINGAIPVETDFGYFLGTFKERYNSTVVRDAIKKMTQMLGTGIPVAEANSVLESTLHEVHSINRGQVFDEGSLGDDIVNIFREYEAIANEPQNFKGVMSGFPSLDAITNGFFGGELVIIAGFEASGKSMLAMNMAINAWLGSNKPDMEGNNFADDGKNVVYFSLEMPRSNRGQVSSAANLNKRMTCCLAQIPDTEFRTGTLNDEQRERFKKASKFIKKYDKQKKLYVVDLPRGATVEDIEVKYLEIKEKFPVDEIFIDYIGLMAGAEDEADWEAQKNISAGLHELARVYHIPIITPVQLNRPGGANHSLNKQNYNNTRIARSAGISQNATIVMAIEFRDGEYALTDMPIHLTKMRNGRNGTLLFMKDFAKMRIYDASTIEVEAVGDFVDLGEDNNE